MYYISTNKIQQKTSIIKHATNLKTCSNKLKSIEYITEGLK